jgi:hypothetical protein
VSNEIVQHHDWLPTFLSMVGDPDVMEKLLKGHTAHGKKFRNHIDGYDLLPHLTGKVKKSPRKIFMYFGDDGNVVALRYDNWKVVFMEQRCPGTLQVLAVRFVPLRLPKLFNLRTDPSEPADITSNTYHDWFLHHDYIIFAAQAIAAHARAVDIPRLQRRNLGDPQARAIGNGKGGAMLETFSSSQQPRDLVGTEYRRHLRSGAGAVQYPWMEKSACSWKAPLGLKGATMFRTGRQPAQSIRFMRIYATS